MQEHMDRSGQMMGEYRLLRWLGGGGFGNVYLAEHLHEPGRVAVKVLNIRLARSEDLKAFLNEARTMRLRHPHIVPLLDFGLSEQELPFLVMEFEPLGSIRDRSPRRTQLPLSTVQLFTAQIASALAYAHEHRLVHRDVKPENMLMWDARTVLLSDFGIASVAHSSQSLSLYQGFGGTVPYAAPEQMEGRPRPASDQYSLAVVAYEWLAGRRPFEGTPMEVAMQHAVAPPPSLLRQVPTLPPAVEQVIFTALAKDPGERFSSVWDFAQALQEAFEQSRPASSTAVTRPVAQLRPSPPALPPSAGQTLRFAPAVTSPPTPSYPNPILAPAVRRSRFPGYTTPPPVTVTGTGIPQAAHQQRLSGKRMVLLILLALLLVGSAGLGYVGLKSHSERMPATVTARAGLTGATQAQDTLPAYEQAVAVHGIMEGFDVARSNSNPYERMLTPSNVSRLALRWSYKVGRSVQSTPVEAGGIVYVGSDKLYAFDAGCGSACQPLWSYGVGAPGLGSPAVVMGLVYAGSHYDGPNYAVTHLEDLKLFAFDTSCHNACQPLWSYTMTHYITRNRTRRSDFSPSSSLAGEIPHYRRPLLSRAFLIAVKVLLFVIGRVRFLVKPRYFANCLLV
jgi:serine/threonine protein kinase